MMGGSITVTSELGAGSVFAVELPFACAPDDNGENGNRCGNGQSVLIVNQVDELRIHLADLLEKENFRVDAAADADTGLSKVHTAAQRGTPYELCLSLIHI